MFDCFFCFALEEISDEREAQVFLDSQNAVLNTVNSERETSDSSGDEGDDERGFTPVFNAGELQGLSYATLRIANRNFQRVLEIASSPLSYHQTEKIVSESQREVIALLHRISDQQTHHTNELRNAVEFFGRCHDQTSDEIRQLSNEVFSLQQELAEVRNDDSLRTTVLSLISERLNIIQRNWTNSQNPRR